MLSCSVVSSSFAAALSVAHQAPLSMGFPRQECQSRLPEFEQTPGESEGQGILECFSPWGRKVRHDLATEQQSFHAMEFYSPRKKGMQI